VNHERQCSACGFTFGGNLAIGSPLCGPCIDLNMRPLDFLDQQLQAVADHAFALHMKRHAVTYTLLPKYKPALRAPSRQCTYNLCERCFSCS
jgi:hypothetical protein